MKECSKSVPRRLAHPNFSNRYFVGDGLDIGGKPDPLALYVELFSRMRSVRTWDWEDGDAQHLATVADQTYDFVHSSHCLEHLHEPREGLRNWFRVLKPGGHLIVTVPDEDLYEQGRFPPTFNLDHKWTFTIHKPSSWSARSVNVLSLVEMLGLEADVQRIELLNSTYRYGLPRYDQTLTPVGESGIEFVVRKRLSDEIARKGCWRDDVAQPAAEIRRQLNQYRDDMTTLKTMNQARPPFTNEDPL
jgi:SAM-dependent methyltransferase